MYYAAADSIAYAYDNLLHPTTANLIVYLITYSFISQQINSNRKNFNTKLHYNENLIKIHLCIAV